LVEFCIDDLYRDFGYPSSDGWIDAPHTQNLRSELMGHHNPKYFRQAGEKTDRSKIGGEHGFETFKTGMTMISNAVGLWNMVV
jgi:hypothetical protein